MDEENTNKSEEVTFLSKLRSMSKEDRLEHVDELLSENSHKIIDDDYVASLMAETNAVCYDCDSIRSGEPEISDDRCEVEFEFTASGTIEEDIGNPASKITGSGSAIITADRSVTLEILDADVEEE